MKPRCLLSVCCFILMASNQYSSPCLSRLTFGMFQIAQEVVEELNLRPEDVFLGQGTLRPDLIESASSLVSNKAEVIKTHHNDTELIRQLRAQGRVVEPLKDFHKDEVITYFMSMPDPQLNHCLL